MLFSNAVRPDEAASLADEGAILLDVREPSEWTTGRAPNAVHIPLGRLDGRASSLDQDHTIVTICRSGARSGRAARYLRKQGFDARNLKGGMRAWTRQGLPVVRDGGRPGSVA